MGYTVAKGNQRVDPDQVREAGKIPGGAVDLRSDTVTRPTPEMRRAMAEAEVGDDVYGEDPTVNRLEKRAAEIFGKEAALFVPTGCMGNLTAIKVWTHHGDEVICEERSHVNLYELASMSAIAGCMPRAARGEDGILTWKQIEAVIRPKIYYDSQTALVCLENTSNMAGGTVYPTAQVADICDHAHAASLKVHLDGARIFNAATALGDNVAQMTHVLFVQGTGRSGWIDDCGHEGVHRKGAGLPENVRWRDATSGRDRRGWIDCTGKVAGAAAPRSRKCQEAGGGHRRHPGVDDRSEEGSIEHRYF